MNSKQRKQQQRRLEEALASVGVTNATKKLAHDQEAFAVSMARQKQEIETSKQMVMQDRADLTAQVKIHNDSMKEERLHFQNRADQLQNVSILRDVLIDLECGLDPLDIAAKLRKQFDLLIPQW